MSKTRVVMIGLDAFDPQLAASWADQGELPTLARLFAKGTQAAVHNPFGLFVGSLWVNFASALKPHRHRYHCWDEVDPRTYEWRRVAPEPGAYASFWKAIGDAGRRVAAIDVPHSKAPASLNGIEIAEWGCHDRHFGFHATPARKAAELAAAHGLHPILGIDAYAARDFAPDDYVHRRGLYRTIEEDRALLDGLKAGARTKGAILRSLLAEEQWDLFVGVFGESHAVGHQLFHLHDPGHPRFSRATQTALGGDPVLQVYREIDQALGRLLGGMDADTTILVQLSHGMTVHNDGTHLLDEVLRRLDGHASTSSPTDHVRQMLKPIMPALRRAAVACRVPERLRRIIAQRMRGERPAQRARQRFFLAPNNFVYSGIRLNLIGREPQGKVSADEVDETCRGLERDLLELINQDTGRPAIRAVTRSAAYHQRLADDTIPDLFVEWDRTAAIETVTSAKIGTVHALYDGWRTGDHRPDGLLIAMGPDIAAGGCRSPLAVEDIGPSIAARLGARLNGVDGEVVPWLAGVADRAALDERAAVSG